MWRPPSEYRWRPLLKITRSEGSVIPFAHPQFLANVCCGQTAGWIKMPLGTEVDLGPGHIVKWGPSSPTERGTATSPPFFGPCLLWPNGGPSQQHCSSHSIPMPYNEPLPQKCPFPWGSGSHGKGHGSLSPQPKRHLDWFSCFWRALNCMVCHNRPYLHTYC